MIKTNCCKGSGGRIRFLSVAVRCFCALSVLLALAVALSACAFLPTEDDPLPPPMLSAYENRQPAMAVVRRDDLVQTRTISCRSRPIREQTYSFPIGGIYVDRVYVTVGDSVRAGDMLAELERKEILTQVEEAKIAVRKQEYALEQAMDDTALRREYYNVQYMAEAQEQALEQPVDWAALIRRYDKAVEDYEFAVSYAEKLLEISQRKLDTLLTMADERVIYATIDGVVSYAQRYSNDDRSIAGDKVFTVSDASELIYSVSGDDTKFFTIGEVYQMKVSKSFLDIRAVSPEDIGETPSGGGSGSSGGSSSGSGGSSSSSSSQVIYFVPDDLATGLASYGYITVETDRRDNVLYLPANAIIQVGDAHAVYRVGESGFRELAPVEIGVTITGKTEIISGLSEGDEVILG
ncbi:MAG: biotin/lipoyl-binding protein [Oscillospiraceae bacterium]|nr:biotin/lipoyl-binding protein [Oscillospiraceae bacterium]